MGVATLRPKPRPLLRGRLHQGALVASVPAGALLVRGAHGVLAMTAASVYAVSLTGLFAASTAYHRLTDTRWDRPWLRWLDHSAIFCLIAGCYTPLCVLVAPRRLGIPILVAVWMTAAAGTVLKLVWRKRFRVLTGTLYMVMGWAAVLALPIWIRHLAAVPLAMMVLGGLLYTVGAVVLHRKSPDPSPRLFGYHEIWHLLVVAAAACHFTMIYITVTANGA